MLSVQFACLCASCQTGGAGRVIRIMDSHSGALLLMLVTVFWTVLGTSGSMSNSRRQRAGGTIVPSFVDVKHHVYLLTVMLGCHVFWR